ncbi:MAG: molybdate ABC transporter substrate-binding protein [Dehalococcoidia bacterium]|nr:MAG: molybdate ABC transporter substrate-binding protein [Dehalococcoidia bacterium]
MNKLFPIFLLTGLLISIIFGGCSNTGENSITVFAGSASKPALEEAARVFEEEEGIKIFLTFGGSGTMLSQLKIAREGDLFIPGSPDYMLKAEIEGIVYPDSVVKIAYLVPAILIQEGNPQNIQSLVDLAQPGIEVGVGDPETVCVGLYAYEILEHNRLLDDIQQAGNIIVHAESCSKTAALISLKTVDAILGWRVFAYWNPDDIDVVFLQSKQLPRLAYIPGAISTFTNKQRNAQAFLNFLTSEKGQQIFAKWGYLATEQMARQYAPDAEIGGEYSLPDSYEPLAK